MVDLAHRVGATAAGPQRTAAAAGDTAWCGDTGGQVPGLRLPDRQPGQGGPGLGAPGSGRGLAAQAPADGPDPAPYSPGYAGSSAGAGS